jgi:hypothetical protein
VTYFAGHVRSDGVIVRWESRRHRKHLQPAVGSTWWAPRARGWWIAVLFAIGSLLFALGSVPAYASAVGARWDSVTYFTGSLFFTRRAYLIGTVTDRSAERIDLRPAFIGIRSFLDDDPNAGRITPGLRVYPSEIGQFGGIDFACPVAEAELAAIRQVPEETVKNAFATLTGESYVPKDWGGERSDLYTSRAIVRGRQVSAAWLFKGRGHPYPMTVKALGKPGDQIGRLFSEPAELLVLQHCHQVTTAVVDMMDTYAHDLRNPRTYMIIDGADTSRILKSLGLLPVSS